MSEFRNESGLDFVDISCEAVRTYAWSGGQSLTIEGPLNLHVAPSGSHRIFDGAGRSHYIPAGWIHLTWTSKEGAPHFVK
jgi:hypothetical protein